MQSLNTYCKDLKQEYAAGCRDLARFSKSNSFNKFDYLSFMFISIFSSSYIVTI